MSKENTMPDNIINNQGRQIAGNDEEISLLDLTIILAKNKERILGAALVVGLLAAGLSFLIPNSYTAKTQVLPPQSQSGSSALLGQLGALTGLTGGALGVKNTNDIYVGILNSRSISDGLIERFKLQSVYETKLPSETRDRLQKSTTITTGKDGIIAIEVSDTDPKRAAALANGYVDALQMATQTLAVTEASQRRLFFEKQLQQAKDGLSGAEVALKAVQEKTGLIQLTGQAEGIIRAASELKAQIAAKEVALGAMRTFATTNNPEYIRTRQEIMELSAQLNKVETRMNVGNGDISIPTNKVPEAGLEYTRRMRDVKYYEAIFELIAKQFEIAKIDEAKEGSVLQVLDKAIVPDKKSKPSRSLIVIAAAAIAGFLAACWAFIKEASGHLRNDPSNGERLQALRKYSKWGSRQK